MNRLVLILVFSIWYVHADAECIYANKISSEVAVENYKGGFEALIQLMYGNNYLGLDLYKDIIDEFGNKFSNDPRVKNLYTNTLNKEFSCDELKRLYSFTSSSLGVRFIKIYRKSRRRRKML